ncbi:class I SAM-dependent methyltransferase [Rhodopila sp.]|uniref:class I SAM-dependent methyltransferase n=1 Tax=Rhodopila sp. TaxID=2480087 RepID=UPI003D11A1ED
MNSVEGDATGSDGPDRDVVDAPTKRGGSAAAISHHYDLSNEFYTLWLDQTLTYSCALWNEGDDPDDLTAAQLRKLDFHLAASAADRGRRILDIGCGWGSLLRRAVSQTRIEQATGLTLSEAQFRHIDAWQDGRVRVLKESWIDHAPAAKYDSIVSIGALEHFASPGDRPGEKIALYREFLSKCRSWLAPGGAMSLQTIAYGTMRSNENNAFISTQIFPDSELPQAHEILEAASGVFEVTLLRNDRTQYGRTCDLWYRALHRRRDEAVEIVGEQKVRQYEAYLRMSAFGFHTGRVGLLRLAMVPVLGS